MKGTLYGLISNQTWTPLGGLSYLEDIALHPGDSRGVEDDREQSNTAESCSLRATVHIVLAPAELSGAHKTEPEPGRSKPGRVNGCQLPGLEGPVSPPVDHQAIFQISIASSRPAALSSSGSDKADKGGICLQSDGLLASYTRDVGLEAVSNCNHSFISHQSSSKCWNAS